jgi:hypothetical protein
MTAAGAVRVRAPQVNDKRIDPAARERKRFRPVIVHKSPKVAEALPCCICTACRPGDSFLRRSGLRSEPSSVDHVNVNVHRGDGKCACWSSSASVPTD